jgi:hypothetical protein
MPHPQAGKIHRPLTFARLFTTNIPNVDNPVWELATIPLRTELERGPMTIDAIVAWGIAGGDSGSVIRHKLAWLSFKNLASYDKQDKRWTIDTPVTSPATQPRPARA